jgi:hypothetical protein
MFWQPSALYRNHLPISSNLMHRTDQDIDFKRVYSHNGSTNAVAPPPISR